MEDTTLAPAEGQNEAVVETTVQEPVAEHPADALPNDLAAAPAEAAPPVPVQQWETEGGKPGDAPAVAVAPAADPMPEPRHFVPSPDVWEAIESARREERMAEDQVESVSEQLKYEKKRLDVASKRLGQLIDEAKTPTLFGQRKMDNVAAEPARTAACENMPNPIQAPDPDAWKSVPVGELIPDAKVAGMLADAGICTFEQVSKWRANHCEPKIRGLGDAKVQIIDDAFVSWWVAYPRPVEAPAAVEESPAATTLLQWNPVNLPDSTGEEYADNTAGVLNLGGDTARFFVLPAKDGSSEFIGDCGLALGGSLQLDRFASVALAKEWCEARNAELVVAARKPEPAPADEPPAKPKRKKRKAELAGV